MRSLHRKLTVLCFIPLYSQANKTEIDESSTKNEELEHFKCMPSYIGEVEIEEDPDPSLLLPLPDDIKASIELPSLRMETTVDEEVELNPDSFEFMPLPTEVDQKEVGQPAYVNSHLFHEEKGRLGDRVPVPPRSDDSGHVTTKLSPPEKMYKWSTEEDTELTRLFNLHGPKAWAKIAEDFNKDARFHSNPNRKQCRQHWFRHLDPTLRKGEWTEEEDDALDKGYKKHGRKWTEIAKTITGRTNLAARNRWGSSDLKEKMKLKLHHGHQKMESSISVEEEERLEIRVLPASDDNGIILTTKLSPSEKKRHYWSTEEDAELTRLVENFVGDTNWLQIAADFNLKFQSNLNSQQCSVHWLWQLNPTIQKGSWTEKEDDALDKGHKEFGGKWVKIAKTITGRTDLAARNRWGSQDFKEKMCN